MSEVIRMFIDGTKMIFNSNTIEINRKKNLDTKKELRIAKVIRKKSSLTRATDRIRKIKEEALS